MPLMMMKIRPDLFFSPEGYMPRGGKYPKAITMHDVAYERYPSSIPKLVRQYYKRFFRLNCIKADIIFTVSHFSKSEILNYYPVSSDKIKVVYNASNPAYHPVDKKTKTAIRLKYTEGKPFFIFIGAMYPRKNITVLMKAFDQFREKTGKEFILVLVGSQTYITGDLQKLKQSLQFGSDIIFTGRIADVEELNKLLSSAAALTYLSLYEGFGIPCIEAMNAGTAVIASDTSSLPEVCLDAAVYANPNDVQSIVNALKKITSDEELRLQMIERGQLRAQEFSWDKTASDMWSYLMMI
jgi:glycosyltransferase involved in cell wall biosynthesis